MKDKSPMELSGTLEYLPPGDTMVFSKEEWEEGALWKHAVVGAVVALMLI